MPQNTHGSRGARATGGVGAAQPDGMDAGGGRMSQFAECGTHHLLRGTILTSP
jgi:hypothetical protein